ncbi:O-antigen ligase family protein [Sphingomonas sp. GC_Shp_3]|uniref:O-antigen ligase family protein n=1 Tax=Sphingomonas sp. GC_Shp_3 TaxID=2937383 RepID=UPI00226A10FB|nr:O-antigen ligase family protein [Sphingomonas sp. GC_Shp_3]
MKISTTFIPVFLFILLLFSGVTWSLVDSQQMVDTGGAAAINVFNGKAGLIAGLVLVSLYLAYLRNPIRAMGAPLALFCVFAAASAAWASNPGTTLFALANLLLLLATVIIAHKLLGFAKMVRLVWLLSTVMILISVALALIDDRHALMGGLHTGRWRGIFAHKNAFGQFLAVNMLISAFGRRSLNFSGLTVSSVVLIDVVALVMADSATADIGVAAGLFGGIALLPIPNRALRNLWRYGAIAVACLLGAVLLLQPEIVNNAVGRDPTMSSRGDLWQAAMPITFQRTLGSGYGTGGGLQVSIELQKRMNRTTALSVQSGFINTALELGWIAVLLYVVWAGAAVASALLDRNAAPTQTLLIALLALHMIESVSEVNGCFAASWLLLIVMVPMIEVRLAGTPRFGLTRRRYTSIAPANARPAPSAELPA